MKKYIFQNKALLFLTLTLGVAYSVSATLIALLLREIIDVASAGQMPAFWRVIGGSALYMLVLGTCHLLYATLSKKFVGKVTTALRTDMFRGVFHKDMRAFRAVNSADYLSALTNDVKLVEDNYLTPLLLCLQNVAVFATALAIMLYFSPMVLLCLIAAAALLFVVPNIFTRTLQKRQDSYSRQLSGLTVAAKDFLSGFEVIRSYRMHDHVNGAFQAENTSTYRTKYSMDKIVAWVESVSSILGLLVQFSILFVSAYLIIRGEMTVGTLMAVVNVAGSIVAPIQVLLQNVPKLRGTKPIVERLTALANESDRAFAPGELPTFREQITVEQLRFGYDSEHEVLGGVNFVFERGKKYALIGKSGCGKTTLVNLLTGYSANYRGQICYDGRELRGLDGDKLSEMAAVIHQNVYLFDESIGDNILLHKSASEEDLNRALDLSGVQLFLNDSKHLGTPVGENGSNMSGGQRQRIAVARALVQKKPLLILDEGTSAVDMQTAYDIESRLLQMDDLTLITITHQLNPELLRCYDGIIFMEEGQIREAGTFDQLIDAESAFRAFCNVQTTL